MPTRITEIVARAGDIKDGTSGRQAHRTGSPDELMTSDKTPTLFKVEGTLHRKDAELLESLCRDVSVQTGRPVALDLSDLCFLDSESATVLSRLKREQGVSLEGLNLFIKKVLELADVN